MSKTLMSDSTGIAFPTLSKKHTYLLACSGGIDSVVLAHLMHCLQLKFEIAHVNYALRGKESDADEKFVIQLANKLDVKVHILHGKNELEQLCKRHSTQEAARLLRYTFFNQLYHQNSFDKVLTAHNANDQVETTLLNLFRGTGIKGLGGMPQTTDWIHRPMLHVFRVDIEKYARANKIKFRTDSTNLKTEYNRNYIRSKIIPMLEKRWPQFSERVMANNVNIKKQIGLYEYLLSELSATWVAQHNEKTILDLNKIKFIPETETVLFEFLKRYGFNIDQCAGISAINNLSETKFFESETHVLAVKSGKGTLTKRNNTSFGEYIITEGTTSIVLPTMTITVKKKKRPIKIPTINTVACIDANTISFPLKIRKWKAGDVMCPLGMKGKKKKISDLLTEAHLNTQEKKEIYVLEDATKIIWLIGMRLDERVKINDMTKKCIEFKCTF